MKVLRPLVPARTNPTQRALSARPRVVIACTRVADRVAPRNCSRASKLLTRRASGSRDRGRRTSRLPRDESPRSWRRSTLVLIAPRSFREGRTFTRLSRSGSCLPVNVSAGISVAPQSRGAFVQSRAELLQLRRLCGSAVWRVSRRARSLSITSRITLQRSGDAKRDQHADANVNWSNTPSGRAEIQINDSGRSLH